MDPELKDRWVSALRSGSYPQGQQDLLREGRYCCLGVLCDLVDPDGWTPSGYSVLHRGQRSIPSPDFLDSVGLPEDMQIPAEGENEEDTQVLGILVTMNDQENKSFSEIADWIEEKL